MRGPERPSTPSASAGITADTLVVETAFVLTLASASGNTFVYLWEDDAPPGFEGSAWARILCPRDGGLGVDGLFLLARPRPGVPWGMEHWDSDGGRTFCSNGTRAAAGMLPESIRGDLDVVCSGEVARLRRDSQEIGLRLPQGEGYGLRSLDLELGFPHVFGWTGTPHLVLEVPEVDSVDLPRFAPPLRFHPSLAHGANVSILQVVGEGRARIRSWERGVEGETLCCGQGCSVAGAWLAQRTGNPRWLLQPAGKDPVVITVDIQPDGTWRDLWLSGRVQVIGQFSPGASLLPR